MTLASRIAPVLVTVLLLSAAIGMYACSEDSRNPAAKGQAVAAPTPAELDTPSPTAPAGYDFSYNQALGRVIEKLRGGTSARAWHFAKLLLSRETGEEVESALIAYLERNLLTTGDDAPARNAIEVMRRSKNGKFAPVLMRATGHVLRPLREEALKALQQCGNEAVAKKLADAFLNMDLRTQALVIRVVAHASSIEHAKDFLRRVVSGEVTQDKLNELRFEVIKTFEEKIRPEIVRGALEGQIGFFPGASKLAVLKQLHRAGSEEGTNGLIRQLAETKSAAERAAVIGSLAERDRAASAQVVIDNSLSNEPAIGISCALFLEEVDSKQAVSTLEILAKSESMDVRRAATKALRGRSAPITSELLDAVRTATGSKLRATLELIVAGREKKAVPILVERLGKASGTDKRIFLQALGRLRGPGGTEPLLAAFLGKRIDLGGGVDTIRYPAILLTNIPESEPQLWKAYDALPKDEVRRSHLLETLANMAASASEHGDEARQQRIYERFRKLLFEAATPLRDRLQVLSYLKRQLSLEDSMKLKRLLKKESTAKDRDFLTRLNDFLWEFF